MGSQPTRLQQPPSPQLFASSPTTPLSEPLSLRALPPQPSLEQLKNQAKTLLAAARSGDSAALERLARFFPASRLASGAGVGGDEGAPPPTLARAQLAIAREHGFLSWTRLRRAVELAPLRAQLERFTERPIRWPVCRDAMQALAAAGSAGMAAALEGLSHAHPDVRRGALGFIDHHATDACVPQLTQIALHDPDPDVRRDALHALLCERCKPTPLQTDVLPLMIQIFRQDANRRVRCTAAGALRRHVDRPEVCEAFRAAVVEDPSSLVRRAAVGGLGDDALPMLAHVAQHDPDVHVRVAAAQRLDREPYLQIACRELEAALQADARPQVKREAHLALKRLSPAYRQLAAQRAREANLARAAQPPSAA
jgi:hypothetical protein